MEGIQWIRRGVKAVAGVWVYSCVFIVFGVVTSWGQVAATNQKNRTESEIRKAVFDTAVRYSKVVREPLKKGMGNSHWAITRFNRYISIDKRSPYCSTFGIYCWGVNGIRFNAVNGMAYSWKRKDMLVWHRGLLAIDRNLWPKISRMDAVVCTWSHVEFYSGMNGMEGIITVAGNTRGGKNRGEGVYYPVYRPWYMVAGIYNHLTPHLRKL